MAPGGGWGDQDDHRGAGWRSGADGGWQDHRQDRSRSHGRGREWGGGGGDGGRSYARWEDYRPPPPSKQGKRWWGPDDKDPAAGRGPRQSYVGAITGLDIPVSFRGRILGDRGSNVRKLVDAMRADLGHVEGEHGRPPFVHFNERDGQLEFEIELYPPFNTEECFRQIEPVFRDTVARLKDEPVLPQNRRCLRPSRVQPDDWECPNEKCGNLCFARRRECPLCHTPKPTELKSASLSRELAPGAWLDKDLPMLPKHSVEVVSLAERLGAPKPGECQVVWLVPEEKRGYVVGKQGSTINWIKEQSNAEVVLTQAPELRQISGCNFCMAFVRGPPASVKTAVSMIRDHGGGRLARDGFEGLLNAAEAALRRADGRTLTLAELARDAGVRAAVGAAALRDAMRGAGMRSLLECFEGWPDQFAVRNDHNSRGAAEIYLAGEAPECRQAWDAGDRGRQRPPAAPRPSQWPRREAEGAEEEVQDAEDEVVDEHTDAGPSEEWT